MRNVTLVIVALAISSFVLGCIGANEEAKIPIPTPNPFENKKLGTGLNYTAYLYETQGNDAATSYLKKNPNNIIENNSIRVRISITESNETNINKLKSVGIKILDITNATDIGGEIGVDAFLPVSKIREVEELQFVKAVYVESKPVLE